MSIYSEYLKENNTTAEKILQNLTIEDFKGKFEIWSDGKQDTVLDMLEEWEKETLIKNKDYVLNFLYSITPEQLQILKEDNEEEYLEKILNLTNLFINYPDIYDIMDWEDCYGDYKPVKLSDPFNKFEELEPLRKLKKALNLSDFLFKEEFCSVMSDYTTYSVGDSNSDLREEYMDLYEDYMLPTLLTDDEKETADKEFQTTQLIGYKKIIESCNSRKKIIELAKSNPNYNKNELSSEINELKIQIVKELNSIPSLYDTVEKITTKLSELRGV